MSNTDHRTPQNSYAHLAGFIKRMREEKGFTLKTVVERARAGGHRILLGYVSGIESGSVGNPTSAKLKAMAIAFDDSEEFQKSELARCYEKIKELTGENRMKARSRLKLREFISIGCYGCRGELHIVGRQIDPVRTACGAELSRPGQNPTF